MRLGRSVTVGNSPQHDVQGFDKTRPDREWVNKPHFRSGGKDTLKINFKINDFQIIYTNKTSHEWWKWWQVTYHTFTLLTTVFSRDHISIREGMTVHTAAYKTYTNIQCVSAVHWTHTQWYSELKKPTLTNWTASIGCRSSWVFTWGVTLLPLTANMTLLMKEENQSIQTKVIVKMEG